MNQELLNSVAARWSQLGAMLNVPAAGVTPDIERLLLDTARLSSANSRLFVIAASWLALYGDYVDDLRLSRLIIDELETEYFPTLGLLLDWAREHARSKGSQLKAAIEACRPAQNPRPLFDVEQRNAVFTRLAAGRASPLSRRWGRWTIDFEVKSSALRPAEWIKAQNPSLSGRTAKISNSSP